MIKFKAPVIANSRKAKEGVTALTKAEQAGLADKLLSAFSGPTGKWVHQKVLRSKGMVAHIDKAIASARDYDYQHPLEQVKEFTKATQGRVPIIALGADGKVPAKVLEPLVHTPGANKEFHQAAVDEVVAKLSASSSSKYVSSTGDMHIGKDPSSPEGFILLQRKIHPSTPLHEMGHYYQATDASFNPSQPGILKRIVDPKSNARYQMEADAWERMGVPGDEKQRVLALKSYELGGLETRHHAYGAAINIGALTGAGLLARQTLKARKAKALTKEVAPTVSTGLDARRALAGAGLVGTAGIGGTYALLKRRKTDE